MSSQFQRLPLELLYTITDFLDIGTLFQCTQVNKTLRSALLKGNLEAWQDFRGAYEAPAAFRILPKVLQHVTMLYLPGQPRAAFECIRFLSSHRSLPKLQTLRIWDYDEDFPGLDGDNSFHSDDYASTDITQDLAQILNKMPNLQHLNLKWADARSRVSFGQVLSTCRQLTSIYACMNYAANSFRQMPPQTLLTKVELSRFLFDMDIRPLFANSPALRYLRLFKCFGEGQDLLPIIRGCCPKLQVFIVEQGDFVFEKYGLDSVLDAAEIDNGDEPTKGLRFLWNDYLESALPLLPRLEQSQQTLEALYILPMTDVNIVQDPHWSMIALISLPKLTYLNINNPFGTEIYRYVPALLRQCPAISYLCMCDYLETEEHLSVEIFTAVIGLTNLSHLFLEEFDICSTSFIRMLDYIAPLERLVSLSLVQCHFFAIETLYHAASVSSLESLTLILHQPSAELLSYHRTLRLTHYISRLPFLRSLELGNVNITIAAAERLITSEHLDRLRLIGVTELESSVFETLSRYIWIVETQSTVVPADDGGLVDDMLS